MNILISKGKKTSLVCMLVVLAVSCNSYRRINLGKLHLGMDKEQVMKVMKKRPDNTIGSTEFPEGTVEVLQYSKYEPWFGQLTEQYWLYFLNGKLRKWGRPGDWQREADQVYEYRFR